MVCDYIRRGGDRDAFLARFAQRRRRRASIPIATSQRIGLANQTTMLMSESLEIGEMLRQAMIDRYGADDAGRHGSRRSTRSAARRRTGRTPSSRCCDEQPVDLMIVIGGYNSSNTCNLARICAETRAHVPHRRPRLPRVGRRDPPPAGRAARPR